MAKNFLILLAVNVSEIVANALMVKESRPNVQVAQSVERWTHTLCGSGSTPVRKIVERVFPNRK